MAGLQPIAASYLSRYLKLWSKGNKRFSAELLGLTFPAEGDLNQKFFLQF